MSAFFDQEYINEVAELEPILPSGRNFDYREFGQLISFNAYRPLVSFESVKQRIYRKKILIDAGANAFATSPKQLVDNYAALGMQFDELVMFDPNVKGEQKIPYVYKNKMKIIFHKKYVELGTRNVETDLISWIAKNVQKDDFLVLKLDMDENLDMNGPTMEWAFLGDLLYSESLALVDELYIELHYRNDRIGWKHETHSSRQRYDVVRQLRNCGMAIHDWP